MSTVHQSPKSSQWNHRYNWIVALVAIGMAFTLIWLYQVIWLPALFAGLLEQGLPGESDEASRVYALTTVSFALPGVAVVLATLLWHIRPSLFSRLLVLVVASAWFVLGSTSGIGSYTGTQDVESSQEILLRAGARPAVAQAWGDALMAGSIIAILLGIAVGLFVLVRTISGRRTVTPKEGKRRTAP